MWPTVAMGLNPRQFPLTPGELTGVYKCHSERSVEQGSRNLKMLTLQGYTLDSALLATLRCAPFGMTREVDYGVHTPISPGRGRKSCPSERRCARFSPGRGRIFADLEGFCKGFSMRARTPVL